MREAPWPAPPPPSGAIERPRLIARLRGRFDRPVTALVAGPGFGKSVLLRQALADNVVAPRGIDCWVPVRRSDHRLGSLVESIARAARSGPLPEDGPECAERLLDHLGPGTCVVLDDVHRLEAPDVVKFVSTFCEAAPPGLTVLLAGRHLPPALARRAELGEIEVLGESELAFTEDEAAQLLGAAGVDDLGGWPAIVALQQRLGRDGAQRFVLEEVLGALDPADREALAVLAHLGPLEAETAAAALGRPVDLGTLAELPMVLSGDGTIEPHALWADLLSESVSPDVVDDARRRLAAELLHAGQVQRSGEEYLRLGDDDGLRAAARELCAGGYTGVPGEVVAGWWQAMGSDARSSPEGLLLDALGRRAADPFAETTRDALQAALHAAREHGDVDVEVAVLWELGYVCRARGELVAMLAELPRTKELAETSDAAEPLAAIADAMVADVLGDAATAEQLLVSIDRDRLPDGWRAPVEFMSALSAFGRGDAAALRHHATAFVEHAPPDFPGRPFMLPWVDWSCGVLPVDLTRLPQPGAQAGSNDGDRIWTGASIGIIWANAGLVDLATESVEVCVAASASAFLPPHRATPVAARTALAVARGDDAAAAACLAEFLDQPDVQLPLVERNLRSVMVIGLVLEPRLREWWTTQAPGPMSEPVLELGAALLAARSGTSRPVHDDHLPHLATAVPLRWATELVCSWHTEHAPLARRGTEVLASAHGDRVRRELRAVADGGGASAPAARKLLATVGFGSAPVEVRLLGSTTLVIDGRRRDDDEWRRERVRALATLLALRRRIRRDDAAGLLWPDMDIDAARRNLRTTLSYLQRLLEPERHANEAPFYLRQFDDWLELLDPPHVVVDLEVLEADLDEADRLRADGSLRAALEQLRACLRGRTGTPLEEFADHDWASVDAERLSMRLVVATLNWSSLELAVGEPAAAVDAAMAALGRDRYSEAAHRAVVAGHLAMGDRAAARRALDACEAMLDELGVDPSDATLALSRRLHD